VMPSANAGHIRDPALSIRLPFEDRTRRLKSFNRRPLAVGEGNDLYHTNIMPWPPAGTKPGSSRAFLQTDPLANRSLFDVREEELLAPHYIIDARAPTTVSSRNHLAAA
jgi:hypothetical protein